MTQGACPGDLENTRRDPFKEFAREGSLYISFAFDLLLLVLCMDRNSP